MAAKLQIDIELHTVDVAAGTVYKSVGVVAEGLTCPNILYTFGIIYDPINKKFCSNPTDCTVALSVPPDKESPVPTVISSITPVPAVLLPISLLVAIDVDMSGVAPPDDVIGLVAPTDVTAEVK